MRRRITSAFLAVCLLVSTVLFGAGNVSVNAENSSKELSLENNLLVSSNSNDSKESQLVDREIDTEKISVIADQSDDRTGTAKLTRVDRSENGASLYNHDASLKLDNEISMNEDEMVRVIVTLDSNSIIDSNPDATVNWLTRLQAWFAGIEQDYIINKIEHKILSEDLEVSYSYVWLVNGFACQVPYGKIAEIEELSGVNQVIIQPVYEVCKTETADPLTVADGIMIGREEAWNLDYTGVGMKIAIIDTGIDDDHQNFGPLSEDLLTESSLTVEKIEEVLPLLNASSKYDGLNASDLYRNSKIAYGFNYVDESLCINHDSDAQGDHGTHVSGIAAANDYGDEGVVGVAKDAQIVTMKVFGQNGGAYTEDLLAAIEDALILDVDVINMSLGSPAGFTSAGEEIDSIYEKVQTTDTILCISAGNSTTMGSGNLWGTDSNLTSNPDNSVVSSPATYQSALSVASVENVGVKANYISLGDNKFSFYDGSNGSNASLSSLSGQDLAYAVVGNYGASLEDYYEADVEGKVALVQRGGMINFTDKIARAEEAGAIACIVFNNTAGNLGMDLSQGTQSTIPAGSITMSAGEQLVKALEEDANTLIHVGEEKAIIASETAYKMSDFSSWGVAPNLSIEPDITAPGGNIYSTVNDGKYDIMSGTSMASPNLAGISALVLGYVKDNFEVENESEYHTLVKALLMSTSVPLMWDENLEYSPRNQGSGLANAYYAISSDAYLTVDGVDTPKAELKDDPEKTGKYSFTFKVTNFGEDVLYYALNTTAMTEDYIEYEEIPDQKFMAMTPYGLSAKTVETSSSMVYVYDYNNDGKVDSADRLALVKLVANPASMDANELFRYDLNKNDVLDEEDITFFDNAYNHGNEIDLSAKVLKVEAGSEVSVSVSISLTEEDRLFMDTNFENGIYVEGYTYLNALNQKGINLSLPYLGFYGDWTKAPTIDSGFYWEEEEKSTGSQYYNVLFTDLGSSEWFPGLNPYISEEFDINNVALSPNYDGYADSIIDIYVSLLRNAKTLTFTYANAVTDEVYFEDVFENANKSYYSSAYGICVPFVYQAYMDEEVGMYDFTDNQGNLLTNNTKLYLTIDTVLDYTEHEQNNEFGTWQIPITIDTEAPVITAAEFVKEDGKTYLDLTYSDNHKVAAMNFTSLDQSIIYAQYACDNAKAGESHTQRFDVTGFGNQFTVIPGDYAFNESAYTVTTTGNDYVMDPSRLFAYRLSDSTFEYGDDSVYGWISFDPEKLDVKELDSESDMEYAISMAEYAGGYIFAIDANGTFCAIKPGAWNFRTEIASVSNEMIDNLAFDSSEGVMYVHTSDNRLGTISLVTGEVSTIGYMDEVFVKGMTFDGEGKLLAVTDDYQIVSLDKTSGAVLERLVDLVDFAFEYSYYNQNLVYDSINEILYFNYFNYSYVDGYVSDLYSIDLVNNNAVNYLGSIGGQDWLVGLMMADDTNYTLPKEVATSIQMVVEKKTVLVGDEFALDFFTTPWNGEVSEELTWSSSDESVAVVSGGMVEAKAEGTTTISVTDANHIYYAECTIYVVDPQAVVYGFVVGSNYQTYKYEWVSYAVNDLENVCEDSDPFSHNFSAAENVNGIIYGFDTASKFYAIDTRTMEETCITSGDSTFQIIDMAYDYNSGMLYGLKYSAVTTSVELVMIDTVTGDVETVSGYEFMDDSYSYFCCLSASANKDELYVMSYNGNLCKYNVSTDKVETIGATGMPASSYSQSMCYDYDTDAIYWAYVSLYGRVSTLYVDPRTADAIPLGSIDGGAQLTGLYCLPSEIPELGRIPGDYVDIKSDEVTLLEGMQSRLPVTVYPFNATNRVISWTVADSAIAEVSNGTITGKAVGQTTVTGTLEGIEPIELSVSVLPSAGDIYGYVLTDLGYGAGDFFGTFHDNSLSNGGEALQDISDYSVFAGEYVNGKIYAYGEVSDSETIANRYFVINADTFEFEEVYEASSLSILDMAYDYTTNTMYAIGQPRNVENKSTLYVVDMTNGATYPVANYNNKFMTLACDNNGVLYSVTSQGDFYQIDAFTGEETYVGNTGYYATKYQSMTVDHKSGNLYWAQIGEDAETWETKAEFLIVNTENANVLSLGKIGSDGCQVTALYIPWESDIEVKSDKADAIYFDKQSFFLTEGQECAIAPYALHASNAKFTFTSKNEKIASVDENGQVKAIASGICEILVGVENSDVTATLKIVVYGKDTSFQVMDNAGNKEYSILNPKKVVEKLDHSNDFEAIASTLDADGNFYAADAYGYLWTYSKDKAAEKVSDLSILEWAELDENSSAVVDLQYNEFDEKMYAIISSDYAWTFFIYQLDFANETATPVAFLPDTYIGNPNEFTFVSADKAVVYDATSDNIWAVTLGDIYGEVAPEHLLFAQYVVVANVDHIGLTYDSVSETLFLVSSNDRDTEGGVISIYAIDLNNGTIEKYMDTTFSSSFVDVALVLGDNILNPKSEESKDEPSTEEPSTEEPSTEEPSTEEPSTEEPSTEEPSTEGPSTEEPSTEKPSDQVPSNNGDAIKPEGSQVEGIIAKPEGDQVQGINDKKEENQTSANTGDTNHLLVWFAAGILGMAAIVFGKRKENH